MVNSCNEEHPHGQHGAVEVYLHTLSCEHDYAFICIDDLITWLRRQPANSWIESAHKRKILDELEMMRLHHDLKEL